MRLYRVSSLTEVVPLGTALPMPESAADFPPGPTAPKSIDLARMRTSFRH
jgi:hypothetical protein